MLLDIYTTCIRPTLEYANLVWCGLSKSDCARLERCQRSVARIITGISPLADVSRDLLLARAGLCTLEARRNASLAFFVKRLLTDRLPQHLRNVTNALVVIASKSAPFRATSEFHSRTPKAEEGMPEAFAVIHVVLFIEQSYAYGRPSLVQKGTAYSSSVNPTLSRH